MAEIASEFQWEAPARRTGLGRFASNVLSFSRKKPLGALGGAIVIFFIIIGDLIPEAGNSFLSLLGLGHPLPYLADLLRDHLPFVYNYSEIDLRHRLEGSSSAHLLGTDASGRDTLSRFVYGARVAVLVAFGAVAISETIAAVVGITAGYYGGLADKLAYRVVDVFQALPGLIVLITIFALFGTGLWPMVFAIGVVGGPAGSRVIRAQTLSVVSSPYIEAARVLGASDRRIMISHVLPNIFPLIILTASLRLGTVILIESTVSFLGYGLPPPFPSWGQMLSLEGRQFMRVQPGLAIYPGLAIAILVFSLNMFGDALRDVLDPRLRGSR